MAAFQFGVEKVFNKLSLGGNVEPPNDADVKALRLSFETVGQGHVFSFWDDLSDSEKASFFAQLSKFEPERIAVRSYSSPFVFSRWFLFRPMGGVMEGD